jgi:hypothetical protein
MTLAASWTRRVTTVPPAVPGALIVAGTLATAILPTEAHAFMKGERVD